MRITQFAIKRPVTVIMFFISFLVLGFIAIKKLPKEFFPAFDVPFLRIYIPCQGSSPSQVEQQITSYVEESVALVKGVQTIRSSSSEGGSSVSVDFHFGEDIDLKAIKIKEQLERIKDKLPAFARDYFIFKWSSNDIPIIVCTVNIDPYRYSSKFLEDMFVKNIKQVDGVSKVDLMGSKNKTVLIELSPSKLQYYGLTVENIDRKLKNLDSEISLGTLEREAYSFRLTANWKINNLNHIKDIHLNSHLRLSDVAKISYQYPEQKELAKFNGQEIISLVIIKKSNANTLKVSDAVEKKIESILLNPEFEGAKVKYWFRQSEGIRASLQELLRSGFIGAVFAFLVLLFFLRKISYALLVILSVPASLMLCLVYLYFWGISLNVLSMMGLMLAIGMLVDNAVVSMESIFTTMNSENRHKDSIIRGVNKIGVAITAGTLTSISVFLPNMLDDKSQVSIWLSHIGIPLVVSLVISLILAITIVPLGASWCTGINIDKNNKYVDYISKIYIRLLDWFLKHYKISLALIVFIIFSSALPFYFLDKSFSDNEESSRVNLNYNLTGRYDVKDINVYSCKLENYLDSIKDFYQIESYFSKLSEKESSTTLYFSSEKHPSLTQREILDSIISCVPKSAMANPSFGGEDENEDNSIDIYLKGNSSKQLQKIASDIEENLSKYTYLNRVEIDKEQDTWELIINFDQEKIKRYNMTSWLISDFIFRHIRGKKYDDVKINQKEIILELQAQRDVRENLQYLLNLPVIRKGEQTIVLRDLVSYYIKRGDRKITRINRVTYLKMRCFYSNNFKKQDVREKLEDFLKKINFDEGYFWSFGQDYKKDQEDQKKMLINLLLSLALIYFIMASLFESLLEPLAIWISIVFAIIGVWWFFWLTGTTLSLMGWFGILILVGVVVNNGIVLLDYINKLRRDNYSRLKAIREAAHCRLRPILMTASTTILSLLPLCFSTSRIAGQGPAYYPMARAIVGGLTFSTLSTIFILPTVYIFLDNIKRYAGKIIRAL